MSFELWCDVCGDPCENGSGFYVGDTRMCRDCIPRLTDDEEWTYDHWERIGVTPAGLFTYLQYRCYRSGDSSLIVRVRIEANGSNRPSQAFYNLETYDGKWETFVVLGYHGSSLDAHRSRLPAGHREDLDQSAIICKEMAEDAFDLAERFLL